MMPRFVMLLFATLMLPAAAEAAPAAHPVLVELYTSQGCSDCPPADEILAELAGRPDVVALSFPITYWDMLGWKDTLATEANTQRQKAYAAAMMRGGTYTPQMVVHGREDVVGNQRQIVLAAIRRAARAASAAPAVAVNFSGGQLTVGISGEADGEATLWVMRTLSRAKVSVGGGENKDRELVYTNVVRDVRRAGYWSGGARSFTVPVGTPGGEFDGVAVVLQGAEHGPVLAARLLGLGSVPAR